MQTGEAKRRLRQAQLHALLITVKTQQLEKLNASLYRITPLMESGGHGGGGRDRVGEGIAKMEQLREELSTLTVRWAGEVHEAQRLLDKLQDPAFAEVLNRRYFLNQTWDVIADRMHYSRRGACYLHGRALVALDAILTKEEEEHGKKDES